MSKKHQFTLLAYLLLALSISSAGTQKKPESNDVLGRWDITIEGGPEIGTRYPSWLEIEADGNHKLQGRFVGRVGSARPVEQIEFDHGRVRFNVPVQYEKQTKALVFEGQMAQGMMRGVTVGENGRQLRWSAVRAATPQRRSPPKYGAPINLFNGHDLNNWKLRDEKHRGCWSVDEGTMTNHVPCVDIISTQKFTDFKLHVEFKISEGSNSGVYLRGRYEVQIENDEDHSPDTNRMGGVYGFIAPTVNAARHTGEWQSYDITLVGRRVTVLLNDQTVIRDQEIPGITGGALDSDEGLPGPVMLQGDHGKISFRKIILTPIK